MDEDYCYSRWSVRYVLTITTGYCYFRREEVARE